MRKLFSLFVALFSTSALWAYDFQSGDLYYNITSSSAPYTVKITYQEYSSSNNYYGLTTAAIPETVTYNGTTYSVTSIGSSAFYGCSSLTSITIPNSVTSIGDAAFLGCSKLTSITIPNSVTSIGNDAFASCSSLTSIVVESGNTTYDSRENCNAIVETATNTLIVGCQNTIIPNSVTSIGSSAFYGCSKLTSLTIPNSVTSIGNGAFDSCSSLTSIVVESGNTTYDSRENCNAIIETATNTLIAGCQNTIIPNSVTSIGSSAFYGCSSLTSITIPNSVKSIGDWAFAYCYDLISVACLATTPPTMSNYVFESSRLPSIYIPDNTLSIYQTAWGTNYVYVNNETTLTIHVDVSGTLSNKIVQSGKHLDEIARLTVTGTLNDDDFTYMRASMKSLVDINLSAITNTSGVNFNTKSNLLKIVLPNNLKAIEQTAFSGCRSLTSITIPNSVTSIGEDAFSYCTSLTSVTIPSSVKSIGDRVFSGCRSLTSVTIPSSVKSIGDSTFKNCSSLSSVTIGNNVTSIGGCAFEACSQLTSVTIPNSVTNIGERIFKNCSSLSSVTIGNNVTSIGDRVFYGCTSLTSITIPNSVTSIGEWTFAYCSSLASVTIGTNVTAIGSCAFYSCDALTSITWNPKHYADFSYSSHTPFDKPEQISSFTFGDAVEHIPAYLCSGMIKLTSITIPNSVTSIGAYAFAYSEALTSITIPNSVKSIGRDAFQGVESLNKTICSGDIASWCNIEFDGMFANPITYSHNLYINDQEVKSLVIPNSVTSIGNCAFYNCRSLTSIIIPNSVTSIGDYAFSGCIFTYDKFINNSSLNAKTNNYWSAIIVDSEIDGLLIRNDTLIACRPHVTSAIIPNSVTSIGDRAFSGCESLTSITIPNGVTSIGDEAFAYCSSLTSIYWNAKRYTDFISYSDAPFFAISSQITSFNFGDSVKYIPAYLCHGMNRLASITIGSNVQELADSVFYNCNRIDTILIKALTPPVLRENVFSSKAICEIPCVSLHHYELSPWKEYAYSFETDPFNQSFLVQSNNDKMGVVDIVQYPDCGIPAIIKTVPAFGYRFVQWNDGNTDSLRTIFIDKDTCLVAEFALSYSGQCGEDLYWSYDNSKLNINGSGTMNHFESTDKPWLLFNDSIITIDISLGATTIGKNAFADQIKLNTVILPYTLEDIGDKAFDGCRRLYNIYCYAAIPPIAELTSFMNYNAQLYIPCEALELYKSDMVFGEFDNLHCINADTQPVAPDTIIVTPGTTDVTITWPTEDNAYQYVIEIKKDGEVFSTLTFNADGQLLNIAFAPGRNGNRPAQYAEQAVNGYRFTVTGLTEATQYAYNITTKDAANKTIATYSGEFTTMGGTTTAVEDILLNTTNVQKLLRNGQLIIVRDGVEYTVMGQEL